MKHRPFLAGYRWLLLTFLVQALSVNLVWAEHGIAQPTNTDLPPASDAPSTPAPRQNPDQHTPQPPSTLHTTEPPQKFPDQPAQPNPQARKSAPQQEAKPTQLPEPTPQQVAVEQIQQSLASGNAPEARQQVQKALQQDPDNVQLRKLDQLLTQHVSSPADLQTLKSKVQTIFGANAVLQDESNAVLASPILWGTSAGAAARQLLPTSLREAFAQRDLIKDGATKLGLQDYSGAEHSLNQAIAVNPRNTDAYTQRAEIRRLRGRLHDAEDDVSIALLLNSQHTWAHIVHARTLNDLGRHQEAIKAASQAIALSPNNPAAFIARGRAEQALGDTASAQKDFKQAAVFAPEFEDLYRLTLGEGAAASTAAAVWTPGLTRKVSIYGSSTLAALFLFGFAFLRRRGTSRYTTSSRPAMRVIDRNAHSPSPLPGRPGIWH